MEEIVVLERRVGKMLFGDRVADLLCYAACDCLGVDFLEVLARYLAHVYDDVGANCRLACDVGAFVFCEARVEDCIGYLVCHFVGMSFRNGLRRKNVAMVLLCHFHSL